MEMLRHGDDRGSRDLGSAWDWKIAGLILRVSRSGMKCPGAMHGTSNCSPGTVVGAHVLTAVPYCLFICMFDGTDWLKCRIITSTLKIKHSFAI